MAAINSTFSPAVPNRRRRVRHKIQTPAYATFTTESQSARLDLHEIVDISEDGMAIQCHTALEAQKEINLCLDLADCSEHIYTTGQVIWSNSSGRAGLRFSDLPPESLSRLREWLFVNVMAGVANGEAEIAAFSVARKIPPRPGYSDTLAAVSAVQRQVEALGSDFRRALQLIAERTQSLLRASGTAIALADTDSDSMICCATSGSDAPPIGTRLQVGAGFSGECVRRGEVLCCDDSESDSRVDRDSCRALGIRSILAAPVRVGEKSVGIVEAFSPDPRAFSEAARTALERLADTVLEAAHRAARVESLPFLTPDSPKPAVPTLGSVLFAAPEGKKVKPEPDEKSPTGISLPPSHLIILVCAAATITFALGWGMAPWIQSDAAPWVLSRLHSRARNQLPTVLASSKPPKSDTSTPLTDAAATTFSADQLRQSAEKGDPATAYTLALRYATGEGVKLSENEAVRWFSKAAAQGYVPAQSRLGSIYYSGRGVPQDLNRAYFWMVVARTNGDEASNAQSPLVRARLTRSQVTSIELDAAHWLQQHRPNTKPAAGQLKIEALDTRRPRTTR
jgi:putative methionine-R-sulfoxide reductase with GAF domain